MFFANSLGAMDGQVFDQISGQGFLTRALKMVKAINTVYSTTRPKKKPVENP